MSKQTLDRELWKAVEGFEIDEVKEGRGPERTFEARLAEEQGWSREFASRVVGEYRKFVYLAAVGGHPVTPSEAVDEAWHLHLMYTRSYWERLCGEVLKRPLHHEPSRGGGREEKEFEDWYLRTLKTYREVFGEEAPGDVWPRGGKKEETGSVRFWKRRKAMREATVAAVVGAVGLGMVGCVAATGAAVDPWFVVVGIAVTIAAICLGVAMARGQSAPSERRRDDGSGCGATAGMYGVDDSDGHHGHGGHDAGHGGDAGGHGGSGATGSDGGGTSCGSSGGDGGGAGCGSLGCGGGGCGGS